MKIWSKFAAALLAPLLLAAGSPVLAQNYPARNITMIVPFPAGGAGGTLGATRASEAAPDGYTIFAASMGAIIAAPSFYPNLKYDSTKDFEPIGMSANAPAAIAIKKDFPANNVKEFVAYAQKHGADIKQGVGGIGGTSHMACLLFNKMFDLKPTLVIYRGAGPAMNDLVGGHIDYFCEQAVSIAPSATGGKVKGIIISTNERLAAMPDVPGAKEAGAPDFQLNVWSAVFAPKGTPKDIVGKLATALDKTLDEPATAEKLAKLGGTVPPKTDRGPDHLRKTVASDVPRWAPILKEAAAATKSN